MGGVVFAALALFALVLISHGRSVVEDSTDGLLRLSWRTVGERIETCRPPTEQELAAVPRHMRPEEVCEGRMAPFELRVRVDGETRVARMIRPAGVREDRPIYVFEESRVEPGLHQIEVSFSRVDEEAGRSDPLLSVRFTVDLADRSVVLVTRDSESGDLVVRDQVAGA